MPICSYPSDLWFWGLKERNINGKRGICAKTSSEDNTGETWESEWNLGNSMYTCIPDHQIGSTVEGMAHAEECGRKIRKITGNGNGGSTTLRDWRVYFFVFPYKRTLYILKGIGRADEREHIIVVMEEVRLREQGFGNFQGE